MNAIVYAAPTGAPIRNAVVVVRGGSIEAVGTAVRVLRGARTIDCTGRVITAGFWNSHVHFFERKWADASAIPAAELQRQLQEMLTQYGFTSVFDLGSPWRNTRVIRDRIESGEVAGPRIRSTGPAIAPANPAIPPDAALNILGVMKPAVLEAADALAASAAARQLLNEGVDGIKMFASSPPSRRFPEGAIQAAVDEAGRAGLRDAVARRGADVPRQVSPNLKRGNQHRTSRFHRRGHTVVPQRARSRVHDEARAAADRRGNVCGGIGMHERWLASARGQERLSYAVAATRSAAPASDSRARRDAPGSRPPAG